MTDAQANSARTLLAALYQMDELKDPWDVDPRNAMGTRKTVLSDALRELRTHGAPGPLIRRILALSFYWMARYRIVSRQARGGQEDRRDITSVVSLMASTEHGVRQLVQLIADGRSERTPRRVDAAGRGHQVRRWR
jgi:hypothetical protein